MLDQARQDRRVGGVAWRSRSNPQEAEHLLAVKEQLAMAVGDGARDACLDDRDGQIAEGRHRLRSVARARTTPVLVVGDLTNVVDRLESIQEVRRRFVEWCAITVQLALAQRGTLLPRPAFVRLC